MFDMMLTLENNPRATNLLPKLFQRLHLHPEKIISVKVVFFAGALEYGGISSNIPLMICYGDQMCMSVVIDVIQMVVNHVNQDFHMNYLKPLLLIQIQGH